MDKKEEIRVKDCYYQLGYKLLEFTVFNNTAFQISRYYTERYNIASASSNSSKDQRMKIELEGTLKNIDKCMDGIYRNIDKLPLTLIAKFEKKFLKDDSIPEYCDNLCGIAQNYKEKIIDLCTELERIPKGKEVSEKLQDELLGFNSKLLRCTAKKSNPHFIKRMWLITKVLSDTILIDYCTEYIDIMEAVTPIYEKFFAKLRDYCTEVSNSITISQIDDLCYFDKVPYSEYFEIEVKK